MISKLKYSALFSCRTIAFVLVPLLASCGGGGGGAAASPPPTNIADPIVISAIQSNMSTNYTYYQSLIPASIQACYRTWGASSNSMICSVEAKQTSIQNFLNTVMANVVALNLNMATYSSSITIIINSYLTQDLAWLNVNSLAPTYTMTAGELLLLTPTYDSSVNTSYSNALIKINAVSIQSNMTTNYTDDQYLVSASTQACYRTWGLSSNAMLCSVTAKQTNVQNYLNTVLANVQGLKSVATIDKTAISTLINSYQAQDLAWLNVNSLAPNYTMTAGELSFVTPTYNSSVNTSYSNALIQLSAM